MLEHVLKLQPLKEILEFKDWKRSYETYKKKKFKPEIKPMIKNLQDELYQLENKQAKGAKLPPTIRWKLEGEKCSKTFFRVLERKNMRNQIRSEFILIIINQNILAYLLAFSNLKKYFYEKFYTKEVTFKTATTEFLSQIPNRKKYQLNNSTFVRLKFFRWRYKIYKFSNK